ncbi:hypothetical protein OF83DRAFT_1172450 [Amylostereum chailletii]|nr:hypothetical protein OF83DRAFT_1172450 [Amylostereum chailletii]
MSVSLDNTQGALLIGLVLSTAIFGITCLQVYLYFTEHSAGDGHFLKLFVAFLLALDTLHVALVSLCVYHYTITSFGDFKALGRATWSLNIQVVIGTLMSLLVQCFFARRVYYLSSKRIVVPSLIVILSLGQLLVGGIVYVIHAFGLPLSIAGLSLDLVCDTLIAGSMIFYLLKHRSKFSRTNNAINVLVTYSMNTCLLITLFTLICLVLWLTETVTLIYAPFFFILIRQVSSLFVLSHDDVHNRLLLFHFHVC